MLACSSVSAIFYRKSFWLFCLYFPCLASQGSITLPQLESDEQVYDQASNRLIARGNAELAHENLLLQADEISINQSAQSLSAHGDVRLTRDAFRIVTRGAEYNYNTRDLQTEAFRMGRHPAFLSGSGITGSASEIIIYDGQLYFHEPDPYSLNLRATRMTVDPEEREIALEEVTFYLGPVPFMYLPRYRQSLDKSPIIWWTDGGYRKNLGGYWRNQLGFRLNPQVLLGANLDAYGRRGFLGGPVAELDLGTSMGDSLNATLDSGFIHDLGSAQLRGTDVLGHQIDASRNFIEFRAKGHFDDVFDLTSSLSWWSDSDVTRDFRPSLFRDNQVPDSFTEGVYRNPNFILSAFTRYQPNNWETIVQRLPEIRFDWIPSGIGESGVYQRFNAAYAHLVEKDPLGVVPELETNRLNAYYGLYRPIHINHWLSATPVAGGMATHYSNTYGGSTYTRVLGEVGFDAEAELSGHWDYQNDIWRIDGLRHKLKPVVQYRYIPSAQAGDTLIQPIDRRASFPTYMQPLGLANKRNIDDLYQENTLRLGLENLLQTRRPDYGSRDLLEFNIYQDIQFSPRPQQSYFLPGSGLVTRPAERTFSNLFTELTLHPAEWMSASIFTRFDPERLTLREINTRLYLVDAERWSAYIGNDYIQDLPTGKIQQYVAGGDYRLNERNLLRLQFRFDGERSQMTEQIYAWQTRLGNAWDVEFQLGFLKGAQREGNFQFRVRFTLLTF